MASTIADIRDRVIARIKDDARKLTVLPALTSDVDRGILAALEEYQKIRPRELAKLVTGNGTFDYALYGGSPALPSWLDGFSAILSLVFPYNAAAARQEELEPERFSVVRLEAGPTLRFFDVVPTAPEQFLATYTGAHVLTTAACSVYASDDEALADLAACECCKQLAALFSQSTESSIAADSTNHLSKAGEYRAQARLYRQQGFAKLGVKVDSQGMPVSTSPAAHAFVDTDRRPSGTAVVDYLFHGTRQV